MLSGSMPVSLKTFPAAINVRDFVDDVGPDPIRTTASRSPQLYTELNIPYDEDLLSDDVNGIRLCQETFICLVYHPSDIICM